ncbi:MAG: hypothetical protein JNM37_14620 [Rhodocyclaceae bacterium]|nr:hypothetical protein [Rhodocyclaceae bacterium]
MQHAGLEWLQRLVSEPQRLWRCDLVTKSLFVFGALRQLVRPAGTARDVGGSRARERRVRD